MNNAILRFTKQLTQYDPLLQARVEGLYHKIFEGVGTAAALDNLTSQVGDNTLRTEGDGVFGLSNEAGYDDSPVPNTDLDQAIDDGIDAGTFEDFGTAISQESAPSEDDFGLGDEGPADDGLDLFGDGDTGESGDLGLDGMDDEVPDEGEMFDDGESPEDSGEAGEIDEAPDGEFDLGI